MIIRVQVGTNYTHWALLAAACTLARKGQVQDCAPCGQLAAPVVHDS